MLLPTPCTRRQASTIHTERTPRSPALVAATTRGPRRRRGRRPRRSMQAPAHGLDPTAAPATEDTTRPATAFDVPSSSVRYSGRAGYSRPWATNVPIVAAHTNQKVAVGETVRRLAPP